MKFFSILIFVGAISAHAQEPNWPAAVKTYRQTLGALVSAKTVNPPGNENRAVEILKARLKKEGVRAQTMEFAPGRGNLVARLKGSGEKRPLLLLAHIDVVGADNQPWTTDPYKMIEKDNFLYGRGVSDDFGMAVANLEIFLALKKLKVPLKRDVIIAFTGDEESLGLGTQALLKDHPDWIEAEIALNEGGSPILDEQGKLAFVNLAGAEKTYQDFILSTKGESGHSSVPHGDNAIYILASALDRLAKEPHQHRLLPVTQEYFKKRSLIEKPELGAVMKAVGESSGKISAKHLEVLKKYPTVYNLLQTTCVATQISGGVRANALPPMASATVNCRILPDESEAQVKERLVKIFNDPRIEIRTGDIFVAGGASPVKGDIPSAVEKIIGELHPQTPVINGMLTGATDSRFLRQRGVEVYGLSPLARFEADGPRAHGADERIYIPAIQPALEFYYRLILELAQ